MKMFCIRKNIFSHRKKNYCSCHATWLPCKTSLTHTYLVMWLECCISSLCLVHMFDIFFSQICFNKKWARPTIITAIFLLKPKSKLAVKFQSSSYNIGGSRLKDKLGFFFLKKRNKIIVWFEEEPSVMNLYAFTESQTFLFAIESIFSLTKGQLDCELGSTCS